MGYCFSKQKESQAQRYNGSRGVNYNQKAYQSKPQPQQQGHQLPAQQPLQTPWKPIVPVPSPKPAIKADTILGKPHEDVKLFYTMGKELGRGQFGVTYLCTENSTRKPYACKSISKRKLMTKNDREDICELFLVQK